MDSTEKADVHESSTIKDEEEKNSILTLKEESVEEDTSALTTKRYEMKNSLITNPFRMETDELGFVARLKSDVDFSFYGTENLIWVSSDESVASVRYPEEFRGEKASTYGADHTFPFSAPFPPSGVPAPPVFSSSFAKGGTASVRPPRSPPCFCPQFCLPWCSAVRWPVQRAAMPCAMRCDGRCSALRFPPHCRDGWRWVHFG